MKIKIYLGIIAFLICFLVYAVFFMKSDYVKTDNLPSTIAKTKVKPGDTHVEVQQPDFLPKPIAEDVLKGAEENDYYYYLFINPNRKNIFYQYKRGSKIVSESEEFHKKLDEYLKKVLIDGNYKNYYVTEDGAKTYKRKVFEFNETAKYKPSEEDSKKHIKEMEAKKARIAAVEEFYKECAKTMCIINNKTKEYVVIDKRNIETAKKALEDYKRW